MAERTEEQDSKDTSIQIQIEQRENTSDTIDESYQLETLKTLQKLISNKAVSSALFSYFKLKLNYSYLVPETTFNMDQLYFKTLNNLIKLNPTQIFPSLTPDDSIYLRLYTTENEEIHLEVFYDCEDEEDVEAVASVYDGHKLLLKYYGSVEQVCNKIYHTILNKKIVTVYQTTGLIAKPRTTTETDTQESPDLMTTL